MRKPWLVGALVAGLALVPRAATAEDSVDDTRPRRADQRSKDELVFLYVNTATYGATTAFWLTEQRAHGPNDGGAAPEVATFVGVGGGAAAALAVLDAGHPLRYGLPQSITSGMWVGLEEGYGWYAWRTQKGPLDDKIGADIVWGTTTAGVVGGALYGALGTTPGRASWIGTTTLFTGFLAASGDTLFDRREQHTGAAGLAGLNVGLVAGLATAPLLSPRISRVRFVDLGGAGGAALAYFGCGVVTRCTDHAAHEALFGGMAVGLVTSIVATSWMPKDEPRDHEEAAPGAPAPSPTPTLLHDATPTVTPTLGGVTVGLRGTL